MESDNLCILKSWNFSRRVFEEENNVNEFFDELSDFDDFILSPFVLMILV
jgi:hypothetical protein